MIIVDGVYDHEIWSPSSPYSPASSQQDKVNDLCMGYKMLMMINFLIDFGWACFYVSLVPLKPNKVLFLVPTSLTIV